MIYGSASIGRNALGFALGDIALMFRHSRHAAILGFAQLGGDLNASELPHTNVVNLNATLGCLRGLLREAKGGG